MGMAWYEEWFDRDEYELVYHERDEEEAQELVDLLERTVRPSAQARSRAIRSAATTESGRVARISVRRSLEVRPRFSAKAV